MCGIHSLQVSLSSANAHLLRLLARFLCVYREELIRKGYVNLWNCTRDIDRKACCGPFHIQYSLPPIWARDSAVTGIFRGKEL